MPWATAIAEDLETASHGQERIARFFMRCLFTMFAEDVGLPPDAFFLNALQKTWIPNPAKLVASAKNLWKTMNDGGMDVTPAPIANLSKKYSTASHPSVSPFASGAPPPVGSPRGAAALLESAQPHACLPLLGFQVLSRTEHQDLDAGVPMSRVIASFGEA